MGSISDRKRKSTGQSCFISIENYIMQLLPLGFVIFLESDYFRPFSRCMWTCRTRNSQPGSGLIPLLWVPGFHECNKNRRKVQNNLIERKGRIRLVIIDQKPWLFSNEIKHEFLNPRSRVQSITLPTNNIRGPRKNQYFQTILNSDSTVSRKMDQFYFSFVVWKVSRSRELTYPLAGSGPLRM